nr:MAG TPA: hypothetical protein [Caudoviricetes sp.]
MTTKEHFLNFLECHIPHPQPARKSSTYPRTSSLIETSKEIGFGQSLFLRKK